MSSIYRAEYEVFGKVFTADSESLSDLAQGFWVTGSMEFTKGMNCKFWIPQSAINYVEVIRAKP